MTTLINEALPPPKQLRFVNNFDSAPAKRRRINAACLTCRKRKTRCSGDRPICSTCSKNGHACLGYNESEDRQKDVLTLPGVKREHPRNGDHGDKYLKEEDEDEDEEDTSGHKSWNPKGEGHFRFTQPEAPSRANSLSGPGLARKPAVGLGSGAGKDPQSDAWQGQDTPRQQPPNKRSKPNHPRSVSFSDDRRGSWGNRPAPMHHGEGNKVPYFRYFGPTAIVPGFKQMVVNVKYPDRRRSRGGSFSSTSPNAISEHRALFATSTQSESVFSEAPEDVPEYSPNDSAPSHPLIISLIKTFFVHLGCNYPFLKRGKFLRMIKEKRVEPILVDAMCALATRFSDLPIFVNSRDPPAARAAYGHAFAQRAKAATVDTFPCPTVGAVQAFLLMAYESFGQDQDSALWMYLGLAIRMAVDLGLPKRVGVMYQGEKDPWYTRTWNNRNCSDGDAQDSGQSGGDGHKGEQGADEGDSDDEDTLSPEQQAEVEQERIDTFWAVFVLDRVISSGTGRPVTFRDEDFEFPLPEPAYDPVSGFPDPFPIFIRIIHIYGRVSDVVNNIRQPSDLTPEKLRKLVEMETELTRLYQMQDSRLHFNVFNFQEYVKAGRGTAFILLHFWFHALVIILHQPTLLFGSLLSNIHESSIQELLVNSRELLINSRELSISSAKTIADILSFAELIDPKSFIGNPFTSQPMYIAACAFLMQSGAHSSELSSPECSPHDASKPDGTVGGHDGRSSKHSLLAIGANQNYKQCYSSLQQLHSHWGGVKYILTALDQKSKGIWDCETYTDEEYEMTKRRGSLHSRLRFEIPASPSALIAYSLTGTTNSPNPSLTLFWKTNANAPNPSTASASSNVASSSLPQAPSSLGASQFSSCYTSSPTSAATAYSSSSVPVSAPTPPGNMIYDPIRQSLPDAQPMYPPGAYPQPQVSALRYSAQPSPARTHRLSVSSSVSSNSGGPNQSTPRSLPKYDSTNADDALPGPPTPGADVKLHILAGMAHSSSGGSGVSSNSSHRHSTHSHQQTRPSYTPSSHSSTVYEPSILPPDASPSSSTLADAPSQHLHYGHGPSGRGGHGSAAGGGAPGEDHAGGGGRNGEDLAASSSSPFTQTAGLASSSFYSDLPDLTFNSQEIDIGGGIGALGIHWLDMPGDVLGLFESHGYVGGVHSHMG